MIPFPPPKTDNTIYTDALNGTNIYELKELIGSRLDVKDEKMCICGDLLNLGDIAVLVVPIDKAAPKGRETHTPSAADDKRCA